MIKRNEVVFILTISDFECIANRTLTQDERETICHRYNNESWSEDVECFLECNEIKISPYSGDDFGLTDE